ncbi:sulfotransferase family 2 domain-containing protein [Chroococcus sp. FPU101]|uniref:sulfotransferase family 2 domain-containing protein n=1 Tax=Chroococcus sp. FPU101 TaxID=1974212 RepID=UPI001A8D2551|nr:sulfotransferase family 2 domain-containing protein [Chroococcus sp. FPU101]GFE69596.1 hypothetical protein CFPU101_22060 [Chroococcus sp. FPU101]
MAIICRDYKLLFIQVPGTGCSSISDVLIKKFGGEKLPKSDVLLAGNYKLVAVKHNTLSQLRRFNLISKTELDSYVKFATVRNPFDRFVTDYQRCVGRWWEDNLSKQLQDPNSPANRSGQLNRLLYLRTMQREIKLARLEGFEQWLWRKIVLPQRFDQRINSGLKSYFKGNSLYFTKDALKMNIAYPYIEGVDEIIHHEDLEGDFNQILRKIGVNDFIPIPHTNKTPDKIPYQDYYSLQARKFVEQELGKELAMFSYTFESKPKVSLSHH